MVDRELAWKIHRKRRATEDEMHRREAVQRMLLRVDAIPAGSWLWTTRVRGLSASSSAEEDDVDSGGSGGTASAAPASAIVPIVRTRTAAGRRALLATLFR